MCKNIPLANLVLFAILISIFPDCKNGSTFRPETSKRPQILKGQKVELSATLSTIDLKIIDSLLIILTYGDSYFFHVYNKNTLALIGKFGREGRGPSEFLNPKMMSQTYKIRDSSYLIIYDVSGKQIDFINILGAINGTNKYDKSINLRNKHLQEGDIIRSAVLTADSFVVGSSGISRLGADYGGRFFCYNIHNDKMTWEPFFPSPKIAPHVSRKRDMYMSSLALRPDGKEIASATVYFERIDILDYRGKLKRSVVLENQDIQDFSVPVISSPQKGAHYYFSSISVTQDFIYALDYDRVIGDSKIIDTTTLIKVTWDEKGFPPEIFKITPLTYEIEVDEENNRIFGIESFSSFIYIYEMGKSLSDKK